MPSSLPPVSRRRVLLGAAAFAVLGTAVAACAEPAPDPDVVALTAELDRARSDSELATAAAGAAPPELGRILTTVSAERAAHARALTDELTRMLGTMPTTTTTTGASSTAAPAPTTSGTSSTAAPAATVTDVVDALKEAAKSTADLAAKQSGYRAGLLGSISAACTAAWLVALGGEDDT